MIRRLFTVFAAATAALATVTVPSTAATTGPAGTVPEAAAVPADTAVAAAPYTFLNLNFNMCGNKCNHGTLGVADHVANAILDRPTRPLTATLQEVCARQATRIRNRLSGAGYRVLHVPTARRCDDGSAYGIALVHRGARQWYRVWDLPNPNNHEPRKMVCALLAGRPVLACSTHIDFHGDGTRGVQIKRVAAIMDHYATGGRAAFVAGDFNTEPTENALDAMYRPAYGGGAHGIHTESNGCCRRSGPATADGGRKIDYTFLRAATFTANWAQVVPTSVSDHHKVWASITLK
jgi:endonuclease/exonuclease/phosphatase family metal-dependent hydrolase